MKSLFFLTLFFSLLAGGSLAQAGDIRPSWFLVEDSGEILAVEAQSQTTLNVTSDLEENATSPSWSVDGMHISFIIVDEVPVRNNIPLGIAAWVEFDDADFEINTVSRCEQGDVVCTNAAISGNWMVFTAIRTADDYPLLYAYNITNDELVMLQSGGFSTMYVSNRWEGDRYVAVGNYGGNTKIARVFEVPGPGYETSYSTLMLQTTYLGCNLESLSQEASMDGHYTVQIRVGNSTSYTEFEGLAALGPVWRNCRAEQPDL